MAAAISSGCPRRLSGVDAISLMMMDVLSQLPEVKVCTAYEIDGERTTQFPSHVDDLRKVVPVYETVPGWQTDVTKVREIADLPTGARKYIDRISELVGKPVEVVKKAKKAAVRAQRSVVRKATTTKAAVRRKAAVVERKVAAAPRKAAAATKATVTRAKRKVAEVQAAAA